MGARRRRQWMRRPQESSSAWSISETRRKVSDSGRRVTICITLLLCVMRHALPCQITGLMAVDAHRLLLRSITDLCEGCVGHSQHDRRLLKHKALASPQAAQQRWGSHVVPDKAQALARSISVSAAPVAASHAAAAPLGHLDLETASLAAFRSHKDGLGVGGRLLQPQQLVAEPEAFSRCSSDSRASNEVSAHAATMLDLVGRLLGADLIALTLVGPPDRSFVRDAAGLRQGARRCAYQCLL